MDDDLGCGVSSTGTARIWGLAGWLQVICWSKLVLLDQCRMQNVRNWK